MAETSGSLSTSGISFTGVASGLDTASIVAALVKLEKKPIELMQAKIDKAKTLTGLYGKLKTHLETLQQKASALSTVNKGLAFSVSSSDETVLVGKASAGALAGSHSVTVTQLAKAGRSLGAGKLGAIYSDSNVTTVGSGSVSITYAGTTTAVDVSGKSLNDAALAINDADLGVTASVVNTGAAGSPSYKLVVTGNETGASNALSVTADAGVNLEFSPLTSAQNAILEVDGIAVERDTNAVSDVIEGVTLDLKSTGSSTVTVAPDSSAVKSKIKDLVDAYNAALGFIHANSQYNADSKIAGGLFGQSTAKTIKSSLTSAVLKNGTAATGGSAQLTENEAFASLSMIGIKLQNDGTLLIDDAKLTAKIGDDVQQVLDLFGDVDGSGSDQGIAEILSDVADAATTGSTIDGEAFDGLIQSKQASIQKQISALEKQIAKAEEHAAAFEVQLNKKFSQFETVIAGLKAQQAALLSKLGGF